MDITTRMTLSSIISRLESFEDLEVVQSFVRKRQQSLKGRFARDEAQRQAIDKLQIGQKVFHIDEWGDKRIGYIVDINIDDSYALVATKRMHIKAKITNPNSLEKELSKHSPIKVWGVNPTLLTPIDEESSEVG